MICTLILLSSAVVASDPGFLVIMRDGADEPSAVETRALESASAQNLRSLADDGYIMVSIEDGVTLALDPSAPPLRKIARERYLLEGFRDPRSTRSFSEFDPTTQRILRDLVSDVYPDRMTAQDTKFTVRADAKFTLRFPGGKKSYAATYQLAGPTFAESQIKIGDDLLQRDPDYVKRDPKREKHTSELIDNLPSKVKLSWRVDIFKRCHEEIANQLEAQLQARDAEMRKALAGLDSPPDGSWGKGDVPEGQLSKMRDSFVQSWKSMGYGSAAEASGVWDSATWTSGNVAFMIVFGDTTANNGGMPMVAGIEFSLSGR